MFENQSNTFNTNFFETMIGALEIAPIKISGKYKIVLALDGKLYLDDYSNRRILLNADEKFLPQVANFLKTPNQLQNNDILKYGAYQKSNIKSYHIPFYLNSNLYPKYFGISRIQNEEITKISSVYKYGQILKIVDLEYIGLFKIFNEIQEMFKYPLYFNWEENFIKLFGYSIDLNTFTEHSMNLNYYQANQPYLEVINNKILNTFEKNNIIYPKFLNFEVEFSYSNEFIYFNNFYGFLSYREKITDLSKLINLEKYVIKLQEFKEKDFVSKQINYLEFKTQEEINNFDFEKYVDLQEYIDIDGRGTVEFLSNQKSQVRFKVLNVGVNDVITIKDTSDDIDFQYYIESEDIKSTLYETLKTICLKCTLKTKNKFWFKLEDDSEIKIIWNILDLLEEQYYVEIPEKFIILDRYGNRPNTFNSSSNYFKFRKLSNNDICLPGNPNLVNNINQLNINGIFYNIVDRFKFNNKTIIRFDKEHNVSKLAQAEIYLTKTEELFELNSIPVTTFYSEFKSYLPYEQQKYVEELKKKFFNFYSEWYLPSLNELNLMRTNLHLEGIGNFGDVVYWSSSESSTTQVWRVHFSPNTTTNALRPKTSSYNIRAIRYFILYENEPSYTLRSEGPGEGWIFDVINNNDGTYTYFECAKNNLTGGAWSNITNVLVGGTDNENGLENTKKIINQPGHTISAASKCYLLNNGTNINLDKYELVKSSINKFNSKELPANNQYINEIDNNLLSVNKLNLTDYNTEKILNINFINNQTTFLTPHLLNFDKQFFDQNGNLSPDLLTNDKLRYNWFLIKGICPEYLKSDIRQLRYFETLPKITSNLIKISNTYCETIFLGIKYRLPVKYENYSFAVYYSPNNIIDSSISYNFEINNIDKTIYLKINKYLDFNDLIRGGDIDNEPLIDLSVFYNTINSFSSTSQAVSNFKTIGLNIGNNFGTESWITAESDFKIFKNSEISGGIDFQTIFPKSGNFELYIYQEVRVDDTKYILTSIKVKLVNIKKVEADNIICEDIHVQFFDITETSIDNPTFLIKHNIDGTDEVIKITNSNQIFNITNKSENIFGHYNKIVSVLTSTGETLNNLEIITPNNYISLKENYFRIDLIAGKDMYDNPITNISVFRFPQFMIDTDYETMTDQDILDLFEPTINELILYSKNQNSSIDLFSRNQFWHYTKLLMNRDLKIKELQEFQVRKTINELMINNLINYVKINPILGIFTDASVEYIRMEIFEPDKNIVIWDLNNTKKLLMVNRQSTNYQPYLKLSENNIFSNKSLFNIYNKNFGGENISATGLWKEVSGNLVSSLFCKEKNIEIIFTPNTVNINIVNLLKNYFEIEKIIILNKNEEYIKKINLNVDEYIKQNYAEYLLNNFYVLDSVLKDNKKIQYSLDLNNIYHIIINQNNLNSILKFIFKRK